MVLNPSQTLDPESAGFKSQAGRVTFVPVLRILFHSDLDRIGQSTAQGLFAPDRPVSVGREEPRFSDGSGAPCGLEDPCISRQQLQVTWRSDGYFAVDQQGARPLELFALDGTPWTDSDRVAPGTLIAIGDRVLLLVTITLAREERERFGLTGEAEAMWALREQIRGAAASDSTVLICGESGVGKELVARSIHQHSGRRQAPELVLNCAAIPENLLESELFGHVRGAFTGAAANKDGLFRAAGTGTLFLDEIGELPLALQSKLLRVLQEHSVRPVGGVAEEPVHARVIAASNRDLEAEVAAGRFREDLFYRLTALTVTVPALRERREDIPALFRELLRRRLDTHTPLRRFWCRPTVRPTPVPIGLVRDLMAQDWPGNVRHLDNVVEKLAVANLVGDAFKVPPEVARELARRRVAVDHEPSAAVDSSTAVGGPPTSGRPADGGSPAALTDEALLALLEEHDFVQKRVAEVLGVSHTTIDRRMRELGLRRPRDLPRDEIERVAAETGHDLAAMARRLKVSRRGLKLRLTALGIET